MVKAYYEKINIPTYEVGKPEKLPMFLEKRVYQGSSGKVYPYPTTETISKEKTDKTYNAIWLENDYLKVMILPELGGRIQRAIDKTNNYDFIYYNNVIKPALVGLVGPWISGGIEFNWPQHHRPTTFMPVDHKIIENKDGSVSVLVNDIDRMYGTKGTAKFTLYPNKAYIEIEGRLYNKTEFPQTFLWWANPAVAVNDDTQSVFPPDVFNVMDHGKRDVSKFPIADGVYYKHDYSEGVDISKYKNVPVPTSYMAEKSNFDFVGNYDYGKNAGLLHVADHHISPGKKQWTWGNGDFGKAWDRNLTDNDGPYIELMTGVYTDNQPDFTWLKPFEEKTFKQYFMPYKDVGYVKNATINGMVSLEVEKDSVSYVLYTTDSYDNALVQIFDVDQEIYKKEISVSPNKTGKGEIKYSALNKHNISIKLSYNGKEIVSYKVFEKPDTTKCEPAEALKDPKEIMTNEELYFAGTHIEQYRHATYLPDDYYKEGLKRDEFDTRINNAFGLLKLRRGSFDEARKLLLNGLKRLTKLNPNPYSSEIYYNLGLLEFLEGDDDKAFDYFYKATWTNEQQEMSFYYLALISSKRKDYENALEFIDKALVKNSHNVKARGVKAVILRKLNINNNELLAESLLLDPFDYLSLYEQTINGEATVSQLLELTRNYDESFINIATDYANIGEYKTAVEVLSLSQNPTPMVEYYKGYFAKKAGLDGKGYYETAENLCPDYCFPNKVFDIVVLNDAIKTLEKPAKALYYLGNLYYDKLNFNKAIELFELSKAIDQSFPIVLRNLALGYYNKQNKKQPALENLEQAFKLDTTDARMFLELDWLYKKMGKSFEFRLANYEKHENIIAKRDDLYLEYVTLLNSMGKHAKAYDAIMSHSFSPWEGAEGRVPTQYKISLVEQAKQSIQKNDFEAAKEFLTKALNYPENLGEGKLEGTKDNNIYYYLAVCNKDLGNDYKELAENATLGSNEVASIMYYNDQPADMILYQGLAKKLLFDIKGANACFNRLSNYGEQHLQDDVKIDYFAVSLPDFLIFDNDLNVVNKAHCNYVLGLSYLGHGAAEKANLYFEKTLEFDPNHQNALVYLSSLKNEKGEVLF